MFKNLIETRLIAEEVKGKAIDLAYTVELAVQETSDDGILLSINEAKVLDELVIELRERLSRLTDLLALLGHK
jgi:hypothetical protein